jgi:hypothetical protein
MAVEEIGKAFFFEKKKQKTFAHWLSWPNSNRLARIGEA